MSFRNSLPEEPVSKAHHYRKEATMMKRTILALVGTLALSGAALAADNSTSPSASGHEKKDDTSGSTDSTRAGSKGASGGPSTGVPGSQTDKPMSNDASGSGGMNTGSSSTGSSR
jgi:hypothetical protein